MSGPARAATGLAFIPGTWLAGSLGVCTISSTAFGNSAALPAGRGSATACRGAGRAVAGRAVAGRAVAGFGAATLAAATAAAFFCATAAACVFLCA
jgi:hypothetical protein